ncbi:hypothetical protein MF271_04080 [Deinococcus sp. KNUC1210]|uniref:hypothetical protein n=1 Tax=Deinococcus sp. KNUC1210 TaxID=2917691 RepID=UPI001EF0564E|nr:hypothetical protein [Deinococcus sp. KNUC1210]ULH15823.1 hypothetical protein MF271_04080 [Deinococcus sp. KNUC1210]
MTRGKKPTPSSGRRPSEGRSDARKQDGPRADTGSRPASRLRNPNPPRKNVPQLDAPPPESTFRDRDGKPHHFPDSSLKRVSAQILHTKNKKWRYRPFGFPLFLPNGNEQEMFFDFYIYDNMDSLVRVILVMSRESREVWDKIGRFKQQYPMYAYELWTPETLARLQAPRGQLGF